MEQHLARPLNDKFTYAGLICLARFVSILPGGFILHFEISTSSRSVMPTRADIDAELLKIMIFLER